MHRSGSTYTNCYHTVRLEEPHVAQISSNQGHPKKPHSQGQFVPFFVRRVIDEMQKFLLARKEMHMIRVSPLSFVAAN